MNAATVAALAQWLNARPSTLALAVTLRYEMKCESKPVTMDKIRTDLSNLHAIIDKKIYGRHFVKSQIRTEYWAIAEKLDSNPHVHCGWYFHQPADIGIFDLAIGVWEKTFAPGGTRDTQAYNAVQFSGGNGWAGYACKALHDMDLVILSDKLSIDFQTVNHV